MRVIFIFCLFGAMYELSQVEAEAVISIIQYGLAAIAFAFIFKAGIVSLRAGIPKKNP